MGTIREIVDVRPHPAVVRLDDAGERWIVDAYHLTDDVSRHIAVLEKLLASGTDEGAGVFLIGHYGSGKSHFLAYLAQRVPAGLARRVPRVVTLSLVNFRAHARLEDIVAEAAGITTGDDDRRIAWKKLLAREPDGLLLLIDELSEFLRSKADSRSFNEDVRFLQFLGEFAQSSRLFVVAAMQEQIEHTGDLEVALYRKIKDRYRIRLQLTPAHVGELVAESILVKKPGYDEALERIVRDVRAAFPGHPADDAMLARIYPLHPATLELLEEIRGRFSSARGIVDFTITQLAGAPSRNAKAFLDRPLGELLGPDAIVEHFRDLLKTQPEFVALAERVLPYYDKHLDELFEEPLQRALASRILDLLVLVHLSPARESMTAEEATYWLLFKGTRIAPAQNIRAVERILASLAERGRYVRRDGPRWRLDLANDGGQSLEVRIARELNELVGVGAAVLAEAAASLPADAFSPLRLQADTWFEHPVVWHFHERRVSLYAGDDDPPAREVPAVVIRTPWGPRGAAPGIDTLVPEPLEVDRDVRELLAMIRLRDRPLSSDDRARLAERIAERSTLLERRIAGAYASAVIVTRTGGRAAPPPVEGGVFSWIDEVARGALRRTYPSFETYAPLHGPLAQDAHRAFLAFAKREDILQPSDDTDVELVREGYLLPLRLLRRDRPGYAISKRLEHHELVQLVTSMADAGTSPRAVYDRLQEPVFGLVPDQIQALLGFLVIQGAVDIRTGSRSYREHFETSSSPLKYDRIVAGSALPSEGLRALEHLAAALRVEAPDQWTVFAQRRAASAIREQAQSILQALSVLRDGEHDIGEELTSRVSWAVGRLERLVLGSDATAALEEILRDGSAGRLAAEIGALRDLPGKIQRFEQEVHRLLHLARHPEIPDVPGAEELSSLPAPPSFAEPDAVERWLERARALHRAFTDAYREAHDQFWSERGADPALRYRVDPLARSRHVGLQDLANELARAQRDAAAKLCPALSDLTYEPRCRCGYDGHTAPLDAALQRFAELRDELDLSLDRFFADEAVRSRLAELRALEGLDERTLRYLDRDDDRPGSLDVELLDRCLTGLNVTKALDVEPLIELLTARPWRPEELPAAVSAHVEGHDASVLRFHRRSETADEEIVAWCVEVALRHGVELPRSLPAGDVSVRPDWIGPRALDRLESLGIPRSVYRRILGWILDGTLAVPAERPHAAGARAACDVVISEPIAGARELAELHRVLLRAHDDLVAIDRARWLEHLDARASFDVAGPALEDVLASALDAEWIVVDAWSATIPDALDDALFPGPPSRQIALAPVRTTTDAFNELVLGLPRPHAFHKIDAIDQLVHERVLPIDDLCRIARAEIQVALRRVLTKLDKKRPILVFGDHGFRRSRDGRRYEHGGPSALERLVSVARFPAAR